MSSMRVWIVNITLAVNHGVNSCPGIIRREVSPRVFYVEGTVVRNDLPFEDTVGHRAEHRRLRIICKNIMNIEQLLNIKYFICDI